MVGERILGEEQESSGERARLHLRNSKGPSGVLREADEVGAHKNTAGGARRVVSTTAAPLGGAAQGVSPRVCQNTTNVLGRTREAQQRVQQSRMAGRRGDGEGAQVAWPHLSSSFLAGEGQSPDTAESIERQFRAGSSRVTRDEQEMTLENNVVRTSGDQGSDSQEHHNMRTQDTGLEEDGTLSLSRKTQGSRRVTFTSWVEGTGTEADEGRTKEETMYHDIFAEHYKNCDHLISEIWRPRWTDVLDPSARQLSVFSV